MAHKIVNIYEHHEGDALYINTTVQNPAGEIMDLTGATVEWLLKTSKRGSNIHRKSTEDADPDVSIADDPTTGQVTVHIKSRQADMESGDTEGLIDDYGGEDADEVTLHHRLRVTNADGDRSTGFTGEFEVIP